MIQSKNNLSGAPATSNAQDAEDVNLKSDMVGNNAKVQGRSDNETKEKKTMIVIVLCL